MSTQEQFSELIQKFISGTLTEQENRALMLLLDNKQNDPELDRIMHESFEQSGDDQFWDEQQREVFVRRLMNNEVFSKVASDVKPARPARYGHLLRSGFFRYAAVILLIAGAVTFAVFVSGDRQQKSEHGKDLPQKIGASEIPPGGERAILTLADGHTIALDTAATGPLASQGGVKVVKLSNGQVTYDLRGLSSKEAMWNTISTPKGGQYQVTLPDGTKVWLNASSAITFPTAFLTNKRKVKIEGEVYFEVVKNREQPFVVDVGRGSLVEILGTVFNVNSYPDEMSMNTTLLEGSVKISKINTGAAGGSSVTLRPGQQAQVSNDQSKIQVSSNLNLAQIVAWKNGIFDFTGADLKTVMRQLERWYDINVEYKGSISDIVFEGKMYRNVNLSDVLEVLKKMGVKFELNGKTLIVF